MLKFNNTSGNTALKRDESLFRWYVTKHGHKDELQTHIYCHPNCSLISAIVEYSGAIYFVGLPASVKNWINKFSPFLRFSAVNSIIAYIGRLEWDPSFLFCYWLVPYTLAPNVNERLAITWHPIIPVFSRKFLLYLIVLVLIISLVTCLFLTLEKLCGRNYPPHRRIHFSVLFDHNIRKVFKLQNVDSFGTMLHGVRAALNDHCERPPVLMFLTTKYSFDTALSISKRLAQAFLVAQASDVNSEKFGKILMKGSNYQALEDYWDFYRGLSKRLAQLKVAIISEFQCVHPQVASVLCNLADDAFSPYPKSMILLLVDVDNYFTDRELQTKPVMEMAENYIRHIMTGFLDADVILDLQRTICGRPAFIVPDTHSDLP